MTNTPSLSAILTMGMIIGYVIGVVVILVVAIKKEGK